MTTALPYNLCSGHHKATEEEGDYGTPEEIWSQKCGQQDSSTTFTKISTTFTKKADGNGGTRQNWMEISDLWPLHGSISQVSHD